MKENGASQATDVQQTVRGDVRLSGTGLHSGETCEVVIRPAEAGSGITFVRNGVEISGAVRNVVDTARGTSIEESGQRVATVEHLMASLRGCGVDNARIDVSSVEIPAMDGSSGPFVDAIQAVGTEPQGKPRRSFTLQEPVSVRRGESYMMATPSDTFSVSYMMRYDHPMIGAQSFCFSFDESGFRVEIAPARTFVLYEEVEHLISRQLARGGSLSNTIVVCQDRMSCDLRFADELVRHKILDVIGDLALLGGTLNAEVVAVKSGHTLNVELARKVSETALRNGWEE
jgi:UDP-3-O-[3-hydroxymyristoyl] N-acetylglucosamine deacetylase